MINNSTWAELESTLPEILPKLVDNLAREGAIYVQAIVAGVASKDWKAVNQAAHPLKSMAAHMGADDLHDIAKILEEDPEAATDLTKTLQFRFNAARDQAKARIA
jgi:HPt (histidine-containing phosphotransfer) domain-containing protein